MGGFPSRPTITPFPFPFNSLNAKSEGIAMAPSPAQKEKARQAAEAADKGYSRLHNDNKRESITTLPNMAQPVNTLPSAEIVSEPYYQLRSRPLAGLFGSSYKDDKHNIKNKNIGFFEKKVNDLSIRTEHHHFIGSNGNNFGLFGDGKLKSEDITKYKYDIIKHIGDHKYKAKYIDEAKRIIEENWERYKKTFLEKNIHYHVREIPVFTEGEEDRVRYSLLTNNCQHYAIKLIELAEELAKKNNDTLILSDN